MRAAIIFGAWGICALATCYVVAVIRIAGPALVRMLLR
jgi:hypothetical protein